MPLADYTYVLAIPLAGYPRGMVINAANVTALIPLFYGMLHESLRGLTDCDTKPAWPRIALLCVTVLQLLTIAVAFVWGSWSLAVVSLLLCPTIGYGLFVSIQERRELVASREQYRSMVTLLQQRTYTEAEAARVCAFVSTLLPTVFVLRSEQSVNTGH